ncbi:DUF4352 domain-containing protein [Streptomyces sp. MNU76]|uniref:DUF4352 domain-containing protein n=1 Tax=Streptomyces sp. MNU76 TaxID=2560026 RepID=UPI001E3AA948|nr:DUF4352 domain-containing protein [Streptomyces sp. MNU76]MCC9707322.1 DUF4352 domain-containing protein [Streptomyces sp. MNU76]
MRYRKTAAASAALAGALTLGGVVACGGGDDPASPWRQEQQESPQRQEQQEKTRTQTLRVGDSGEFRFTSAVSNDVADFKLTVHGVEYVKRLSEYTTDSERGTYVVVNVTLANVGTTNGHFHDPFHWTGPDGQVLSTGVFHPEKESISTSYLPGEYVRGAIVFDVPVRGGTLTMPGPDSGGDVSDTTVVIELPNQ